MKKMYFPTRDSLEKAILEAIKNLGGEAKVKDINKEVIRILNIPDEIVMIEDESGLGTKLDYRLRWCRTNLKNKKLIKNVTKGTWALEDIK